jgi:dTDP-4-dehydrorhamnose reductase
MSASAPRVLILGGTGMLGHVVAVTMSETFDVHATVRSSSSPRAARVSGTLHELEAMDSGAVGPLVRELRPSIVVNCLGIVKQRREAEQPLPAITVNALLPHVVAEACASVGARLIHISTDCVFSGQLPHPGRYTEDDLPDPVDLYGRSKLLGEVHADGALTLRTSIIGWELDGASGLLEWAVSQRGQEVRGFANAWFSGLTTRTLARVIVELVDEHPDLSGLYHVAADPISKLDLVTALNAALGLDLTIARVEEPRLNRVLDATRFRTATAIEATPWDEMIMEYAREEADATKP